VRERGFTLLELLLALAILGVVMSLLFGSYFAQARVDRAARAEMESGYSARLALEMISRDIAQLAAPELNGLTEGPLSGKPLSPVQGQGQGYELVLLTRSEAGRGRETVVRIIYRTEEGPEGGLILLRTRTPLLEEGEEEAEVACREVAKFGVAYLDPEGQETETWEDPQRVPAQISLELELTSPGGPNRAYRLLTGPLVSLSWGKAADNGRAEKK